MAATLLKTTDWFTENAIDADFIVQNEKLDPLGPIHAPVSSAKIITAFREKADSLGFKLIDEKGALRRDGRRFNYVATIANPDDPEFAMECGFTNYNDRSRSFRALYGTHCFICSNGCLHGVIEDTITRHTKNNLMSIQGKVDLVFDHLSGNLSAINKQLQMIRETPFSLALFNQFTRSLYENKILSKASLYDLTQELDEPTLNNKNDDSAMRILNAGTFLTTHVLKTKNPEIRQETSKHFLDMLINTIKNPLDVIPVHVPAVSA